MRSLIVIVEFQESLANITQDFLRGEFGASLLGLAQPFSALLPIVQGLTTWKHLFDPGPKLGGAFLPHAEVI